MKLLERVGRAWHQKAHEDADPFEACQVGFCPAVRKELAEEAAREAGKPPPPPEATAAAKVLGSRGGKLGGPTRMRVLTPERRSEIATKAARARWGR